MHAENFLSSWLREDVEGEEEERKRLNEEVKEEESKSGKRDVEGASERVEIQTYCMDRLSSKVFQGSLSDSEVKSVGDSFGFVCVCLLCLCLCLPLSGLDPLLIG